jgi:NAD(P)-dependent dehydrogenase (short-subunit alcohol dehydrogenase family)
MSELENKVCIVTGSNSGIGKETALGLAQKNANVVMVVRSSERGKTAREEIISKSHNNKVDLMICDLSSMESTRAFATEFKANYERLDVLINNAGTFFRKRQITIDGFESSLAVDYLGPFLLTYELLPILRSSTPSRIINISSGFYTSAKIDLNDLQSEKKYTWRRAYANAKLMVLMFTYELARRLKKDQVTVNAVLPGFVATNLGKNSGSRGLYLMFKLMRPFQTSPQEAAKTPLYLASSRDVEGITGKCFAKMKEVETSQASHDQQTQKTLWDTTMKLLGLSQSAYES